jgi:hypothetical protein
LYSLGTPLLSSSFISVPVIRVKPIKRVRHDPAVARSDAKMKRILDRCYIGSLHSFVKIVIPGTGFVENKEMSNWEDAELLDLLYRR